MRDFVHNAALLANINTDKSMVYGGSGEARRIGVTIPAFGY
jgi:hypothetical protein